MAGDAGLGGTLAASEPQVEALDPGSATAAAQELANENVPPDEALRTIVAERPEQSAAMLRQWLEEEPETSEVAA